MEKACFENVSYRLDCLGNKEIAEEIAMNVHSIEDCITSIYKKLEVNSRVKAIKKYVSETNELSYMYV